MRRRIIAWSLIIIFALILYLFSNESVTLALLISVILAMPVSYLMLRLTYGNVELSIRDDGAGAETRSYALCMKNMGALPVANTEAEVTCMNLRTGETDSYVISGGIMPRRIKETGLDVTPVHAGRYEISVTSARVVDPLGIWSRKIDCDFQTGFTVLPEMFDMQILSSSSATMPESDRESAKTVGAVSGDMVDIREYIPGDPVRNIHWKLSEKTDRLLVKELGNPVTDQFLLILDSGSEISQDPIALDTVASVYTSLIHALLMEDMSVRASWTDPMTGLAVVRRITDNIEFHAAADEFLAVPATIPSAFRSIEKDIADSRYAHVVIVGTRVPDNIDNITNGCQATVLTYGGSSFSDRNLTVIGFERASYMTDTAGIEL